MKCGAGKRPRSLPLDDHLTLLRDHSFDRDGETWDRGEQLLEERDDPIPADRIIDGEEVIDGIDGPDVLGAAEIALAEQSERPAGALLEIGGRCSAVGAELQYGCSVARHCLPALAG